MTPWPTREEIEFLIDHDWELLMKIADEQGQLFAASLELERRMEKFRKEKRK